MLIADDQAVIRAGLRRILELDTELVVVGEVEDGIAAVAAARRLGPRVVLMDIRMPQLDGLAATRRLLADGGQHPPRVTDTTNFVRP